MVLTHMLLVFENVAKRELSTPDVDLLHFRCTPGEAYTFSCQQWKCCTIIENDKVSQEYMISHPMVLESKDDKGVEGSKAPEEDKENKASSTLEEEEDSNDDDSNDDDDDDEDSDEGDDDNDDDDEVKAKDKHSSNKSLSKEDEDDELNEEEGSCPLTKVTTVVSKTVDQYKEEWTDKTMILYALFQNVLKKTRRPTSKTAVIP
ncbi:unnamed protein product [Cylindrotheca closterium]|uniref:Uncharacterized protein n=1 Tax=Cylindrotheca closterium TaxID=2856 RepID=A0AAD2CJE4_9STRA|nr:unnamed protein product [Cylindrotheca closterium]